MLVLREWRDSVVENLILLDPLGWTIHLSGSKNIRDPSNLPGRLCSREEFSAVPQLGCGELTNLLPRRGRIVYHGTFQPCCSAAHPPDL